MIQNPVSFGREPLDDFTPRKPNGRPVMAAIMGPFAPHGARRGWSNVESFFNPQNAFEQVHIVAIDERDKYPRCQFGSVTVHPVYAHPRLSRLKYLNDLYVMWSGMRRLHQIVVSHDAQLVAQIYGGPLKFGIPAVIVAKRTRRPSVITLHNDYESLMKWTYPRLLRWLSVPAWSFLMRNATRVRSVSHYISGIALRFGADEERLRVIPNKEDPHTFQREPAESAIATTTQELGIAEFIQGKVVILTVARLVEAKNLENMLRAFALMRRDQPNVVYLLAGDGPLRPKLEALASRLNISEAVRFLGFVPYEALHVVYKLANVFAFVTWYEGQPRALVEAMLAGLPIICADYGQVTEIVHSDQDGLWVSPSDVQGIAESMAALVRSPELRHRLSRHEAFDPSSYSMERISLMEADFYLSAVLK